MTDLHDILGGRATRLALSMRDVPEFDVSSAKRAVRRRRTTRASLVGAAACVALLAVAGGVWAITSGDPMEPIATPSPTPSHTPSVTPSPTPTPSVTAIAYEGRNPEMTDDEALARATSPATGEVWLAEAVAANPGSWADDEFWTTYWGPPEWLLVGHRDGNEILTDRELGFLVEVSTAGAARLVAAPAPYQAASVPDTDFPITVDTEVYYDSLALPAAVTTAEGELLDLRGARRPAKPAVLVSWTSVEAIGGNTILRSATPSNADYWGVEAAAILDGNVRDIHFAVQTPYGGLIHVPFAPTGDAIIWDEPFGSAGEPHFIDFFDQSCEGFSGSLVAADPGLGGPWRAVGTSKYGDVLAPEPTNELAQAIYDNWKDYVVGGGEDRSEQIGSLEEFVEAPAFVAVSGANDQWWLLMNNALSARYWC